MKLTRERILKFPNVLSAIFFLAALVQVSNHIMWRDEIRTWQIVSESTGFASVIHDMRFDAVPVLWNFIVFILTRISDNPFLMQLVHICIATGTVYVVARWAPFSRVSKGLFAFGYFPFFEYAVISRNYSLVLLLLMIACALMSQERVRWWALAIVLFLLTQVSIWGAGFAGLLLAAAGTKALLGPREQRPPLWVLAVTAVVAAVGLGLCMMEILPGPGPSFTDSWRGFPGDARVYLSLGSLFRAWVPIPRVDPHFWNTNFLDPRPDAPQRMIYQAVAAVLLFVGAIVLLARRPVALAWFVLAVGALVGFTYLKFRGSARHDGMLFMVLIVSWWLSYLKPELPIPSGAAGAIFSRLERIRPIAMNVLLGIQAFAGLIVAGACLVTPFSDTRAVADYIRNTLGERVELVAFTDYCSAPISEWLNRPIYSIAMRKYTRYNTQDDAQRDSISMLSPQYLVGNACAVAIQTRKSVLLLLNSGVTSPSEDGHLSFTYDVNRPPAEFNVRNLPSFRNGIVKDEGHELYLIELAQP